MKTTVRILVLLLLSLSGYAQTESVTLIKTCVISETSPAPDCQGDTGFLAGFCAAQRQAAQTPTPRSYYTLEGKQNAYLLSCQHGGGLLTGLGACPVLIAGQQYSLSVKGSRVVLRAPGMKDLKFNLVTSQELGLQGASVPAIQKSSDTPTSPSQAMQPNVAESGSDEIALYTASGKPVAYIADDDGSTIYMWNGKPVAYLQSENIFGFNGKHLGWFVKGLIYDQDGKMVGATRSRLEVAPQIGPTKDIKQIQPTKAIREIAPIRPILSMSWSDSETLRLFLLAGSE